MSNYEVIVVCKNCGKCNPVSIPKGKEISEFECPYCNCKKLERRT